MKNKLLTTIMIIFLVLSQFSYAIKDGPEDQEKTMEQQSTLKPVTKDYITSDDDTFADFVFPDFSKKVSFKKKLLASGIYSTSGISIQNNGQIPTRITDHNMVKDLSNNLLNSYSPTGVLSANLFTGSAVYSYPFELPPGINGLQPTLVLSYNHHQSALRSELGNAWNINKNYIYRDTMGTINQDDDIFYINFNGINQKLIEGPDHYHTFIENYWKITKENTTSNNKGKYWLVITRDGTKYRFGQKPDSEFLSREDSPFDENMYVSMWHLDLVEDTHGNKVFFYYDEDLKNDTYPYLRKIEYGPNRIVLEYEDGSGFQGFRNGAKLKRNMILGSVVIWSDDSLVRRYDLDYEKISTAEILSKITTVGSDNLTMLPPVEFNYNILEKGWDAGGYSIPDDAFFGETSDNGVRLIDINADGFDDIVKMKGTADLTYWLNDKEGGFLAKQIMSDFLEGGFVNNWSQDMGVRFYDVDDDTTLDIVKLLKEDTKSVRTALINNKSGFYTANITLPDEAAFISKESTGDACTPPACPYGYVDNGVGCSEGTCTRVCSIKKCSTEGAVVYDDFSDERPEWSDDDYQEEDTGNSFTPSSNKCYKFEFTGSMHQDDDDSDCYDLYTDDDYEEGDYDTDCAGYNIDAYAGIGFEGNGYSSTWLSTIPGGDEFGYVGDVDNSYWHYRYISEYDRDGMPNQDAPNEGDWSGFNGEICDSDTHTIYCAVSEAACAYWDKYRCGFGCAGERTRPFITLGVYVRYNKNIWDAWDDNWVCPNDIVDNDYMAENNHYKVTEYNTRIEYGNQQCLYLADEYKDVGLRMADINADGKTDIIQANQAEKKVWINTGEEFMLSTRWKIPLELAFVNTEDRSDEGGRIIDVNGDGYPDLIKGKDAIRKTWINDGSRWIETQDWILPGEAAFIVSEKDQGVVFLDINADGLVDILRSDPSVKKAWINHGYGWQEDYSWQVPDEIDLTKISSSIADLDADGMFDFIYAPSSSVRKAWLNSVSEPYLLKSINGSMGAITTLSYKEISEIDNTGDDSYSDVPLKGWVVESINKNNMMQGAHNINATARYHYESGFFDPEESEFRGFKLVKETKPDGTEIIHHFNQDTARAGTEFKTEIKDKKGILRKYEYDWNVDANPPGVYSLQLNNIREHTIR